MTTTTIKEGPSESQNMHSTLRVDEGVTSDLANIARQLQSAENALNSAQVSQSVFGSAPFMLSFGQKYRNSLSHVCSSSQALLKSASSVVTFIQQSVEHLTHSDAHHAHQLQTGTQLTDPDFAATGIDQSYQAPQMHVAGRDTFSSASESTAESDERLRNYCRTIDPDSVAASLSQLSSAADTFAVNTSEILGQCRQLVSSGRLSGRYGQGIIRQMDHLDTSAQKLVRYAHALSEALRSVLPAMKMLISAHNEPETYQQIRTLQKQLATPCGLAPKSITI